jgi:magnesium-transporting ATPase (P-type)
MLRAYCWLGLLEAALGMAAFFWVWASHGYGLREIQAVTPALLTHSATAPVLLIYAQATTLTLAAIVACQDGNVFACRSERASIWTLGWFSNPLIWVGIGVEWVLIIAIITRVVHFSAGQRKRRDHLALTAAVGFGDCSHG